MKKQLLQWSTLLCANLLCSGQSGLDTTFGTQGIKELTLADNNSLSISVQADISGNLFLNGSKGNSVYTTGVVAKTTAQGNLNPNFGIGGIVEKEYNMRFSGADLLLLPYGKLLIPGSSGAEIFKGHYVPTFTRLDSMGVEESVGLQTAPYWWHFQRNTFITAAALTSNGQYLMAGYSLRNTDDMLVFLSDEEGNILRTFGNQGISWIDFGGEDYVSDIVIRENGNILVIGYTETGSTRRFSIAALTADGVLDPTFGSGGKLTFQVSNTGKDTPFEACLYGQDKLLIAGVSQLGTREVVALAQIDAGTGKLDPSFDYDGRKLIYVAGKNDRATAVVAHDGGVYVAGYSQQYDNSYNPILLKVKSNGTLDASLGSNGILKVAKAVSYRMVDVTLQGADKLVLSAVDPSGNKAILMRVATLSTEGARRDLAAASNASGLHKNVLAPNPAIDVLKVDVAEAKGGKISFYSMAGVSLVKELSLDADGAVSVSGFEPGIYLTRVISAEGTVLTTEKLIIQE